MTSNVERDGLWAVNALKRVTEEGGSSTSIGCHVEDASGRVVLSKSFARLLSAYIDKLSEEQKNVQGAKPCPANTGMGYSLAPELKPDDSRLELFAKQREERGFDDTETWSLASTIAAFILPRLKRFKELEDGHPNFVTEQEWKNDLDEMIWTFQQIVDNDTWSFEDETRVMDGLALFSENFFNLWW